MTNGQMLGLQTQCAKQPPPGPPHPSLYLICPLAALPSAKPGPRIRWPAPPRSLSSASLHGIQAKHWFSCVANSPTYHSTLQSQRLVGSANNPQWFLGKSLSQQENQFTSVPCCDTSFPPFIRWGSCPFGSFFCPAYEIEQRERERTEGKRWRSEIHSGIRNFVGNIRVPGCWWLPCRTKGIAWWLNTRKSQWDSGFFFITIMSGTCHFWGSQSVSLMAKCNQRGAFGRCDLLSLRIRAALGRGAWERVGDRVSGAAVWHCQWQREDRGLHGRPGRGSWLSLSPERNHFTFMNPDFLIWKMGDDYI